MKSEAELLSAMTTAAPAEQRQIMAELQRVRAASRTAAATAREARSAQQAIGSRFDVVQPHTLHTAATDWLDGAVDGVVDGTQLRTLAVTEANTWFRQVSAAVRADREEFLIQASGASQRWASQFGESAEAAHGQFMARIAKLGVGAAPDKQLEDDEAIDDDTNPAWVKGKTASSSEYATGEACGKRDKAQGYPASSPGMYAGSDYYAGYSAGYGAGAGNPDQVLSSRKTAMLTCPDCGEPVEPTPSGMYRHVNSLTGPCGIRLMDTAVRDDGSTTDEEDEDYGGDISDEAGDSDRSSVYGRRRTATDDGPSPTSQSGFAETGLEMVTVEDDNDNANIGWIGDANSTTISASIHVDCQDCGKHASIMPKTGARCRDCGSTNLRRTSAQKIAVDYGMGLTDDGISPSRSMQDLADTIQRQQDAPSVTKSQDGVYIDGQFYDWASGMGQVNASKTANYDTWETEEVKDGFGKDRWCVWINSNKIGYFDTKAQAEAYASDWKAGNQFTMPAPGAIVTGWSIGTPWESSPGVARPTGSKTAAMQWRTIADIPNFGWFVNPSDFGHMQHANIRESDGSFVLTVYLADGGEYQSDTVLSETSYPTMDAAKSAAEEFRRQNDLGDGGTNLLREGSKTAGYAVGDRVEVTNWNGASGQGTVTEVDHNSLSGIEYIMYAPDGPNSDLPYPVYTNGVNNINVRKISKTAYKLDPDEVSEMYRAKRKSHGDEFADDWARRRYPDVDRKTLEGLTDMSDDDAEMYLYQRKMHGEEFADEWASGRRSASKIAVAYRAASDAVNHANRSRDFAIATGQSTASRKTASTCSVCGDSIARDPKGEDNRSWHHDNGSKHDHEAKPGKESAVRTAGKINWGYAYDGMSGIYDARWGASIFPAGDGTYTLTIWDGETPASVETGYSDFDPAQETAEDVIPNYVRTSSFKTVAKLSFDEWMKATDSACEAKCGLSIHDLEDVPFMDWYDNGVSPASAASRAIRNSKGGSKTAAPISDAQHVWTLTPGDEDWIGNFTDDALGENESYWSSDAGRNTQPNLPGYADEMLRMIRDEKTRRTSDSQEEKDRLHRMTEDAVAGVNQMDEAQRKRWSDWVKTPIEKRRTAAQVTRDADGTSHWKCDRCGETVDRYRGEGDVDCSKCGASYNAAGQRLRDDWQGNSSNFDDDMDDMEGYERQQLSYEHDGSRRTAGRVEYLIRRMENAPDFGYDDEEVELNEILARSGKTWKWGTGDKVEIIDGLNGVAASKTAAQSRPLYEIADEIRSDWKNVYFGAVPYLDAMGDLNSITDKYGADDAQMIVAYFLSNATGWKGDVARRVKQELRGMSRYGSKTAGYMEGVDCPMSKAGWFTNDPFTGRAVCPTCGQEVPVNDGGVHYDEDSDSTRQVLYPYVHLMPGKTLDDRIGSRTAEYGTTKCTMCGKNSHEGDQQCAHCNAWLPNQKKSKTAADWSGGWARSVPDTNPDGGPSTWGTRVLPDGTVVTLYRGPRNHVRFYDEQGNQHGVEQDNVAPAFAYAQNEGWYDPDSVANHLGPIGGSRRTGKYRAEVAGIGENVWSGNSVEYDTPEEAQAWLNGLKMRWFGYDMARVVDVDTPRDQPFSTGDDVYQNFRTGSRTAGTAHPSGTVFGWPRSADGEIECPVCGSTDVSLSGSNLGSDVVRGTMYSTIRCNSCGTTSGAPDSFTDRNGTGGTTDWDKQWGWIPPEQASFRNGSRRTATDDGPPATSQSGFGESGLPYVTVADDDDFNLGWIEQSDDSAAFEADDDTKYEVTKDARRKTAGSMDGFWGGIEAQIQALKSAKSADDVIRILKSDGSGMSAGDGFFGGSGGDYSVHDSLYQAGWKTIWMDADYYWAMRAPNGDAITYVEGDVYRGDQGRTASLIGFTASDGDTGERPAGANLNNEVDDMLDMPQIDDMWAWEGDPAVGGESDAEDALNGRVGPS